MKRNKVQYFHLCQEYLHPHLLKSSYSVVSFAPSPNSEEIIFIDKDNNENFQIYSINIKNILLGSERKITINNFTQLTKLDHSLNLFDPVYTSDGQYIVCKNAKGENSSFIFFDVKEIIIDGMVIHYSIASDSSKIVYNTSK